MFRAPKPVAAVFDVARSARAAAADLERDGFPKPWLAHTHETEVSVSDAGEARKDLASANEVDTTSDGALGAIGRLFTFAGGSLVRALEDHGLEPEDAAAMDRAIVRPSVVLVVDAGDRGATAAALLRAAGGEVHGAYGRGLAAPGAAFGSPFDAATRTTGDTAADADVARPRIARESADASGAADGSDAADASDAAGEGLSADEPQRGARPAGTPGPVARPTGDTAPGALRSAAPPSNAGTELFVSTTHDPGLEARTVATPGDEPDPLG